ncbi:MAG: hypothetical protein JW750_03770 [Anaerolineaceae bacterium]|nr:hypothetical protein [Anaerolineaceae bacterium]
MKSFRCLNCESIVEMNFKPMRGDYVMCPFCEEEFEVYSTNPFKLTWPSDEIDEYEDDIEDEDDDYDY